MTIWYKANDEWGEVSRPHLKRGTVYYPAKKVWVKRSGVWTLTYEYDVTPPAVPALSLQIIDNRYIKVGARTPGVAHDPTLKRIRILAAREAGVLTTQFGSGFIQVDDTSYPNEAWSDWYYNKSNPVNKGGRSDSSVETYKEYPANAGAKTDLPGGKRYYFAAWSEDKNGNWSAGNFASINMPAKDPNFTRGRIVREALVNAQHAGSRGLNGADWVDGQVQVSETPRKNGFFYHGHQLTELIGSRGTPTILSANIRLTRTNDTGLATANVYLFWHNQTGPGTATLDSQRNEITKVGTINKGETKRFDIPSSFFNNFNTQIKGFGLAYGIQASDYLVAADLATDRRNGEVNVVWEEEL